MGEIDHPLDKIAHTVGQVCLWWGAIESITHDLVLHLSCCVQPGFERTRSWDILHLTLTHMDSRHKFAVVKILAHHIDTPASPGFYEKVEKLINYLDNDARRERNRFVHDDWEIEGEHILRSQLSAKINRPQSRQREMSLWTQRTYPDVSSIRAFVMNLELAYDDLRLLDDHLAGLASQRDLPGARLQPLPEEWKSLNHQDWRGANKPGPPPRPFPE